MEEFDLNKIRASAKKEVSETRESKIARLKAKIAELEEKANGPSKAEVFLGKSTEEQDFIVAGANAALPESDRYSKEDYIAELNQSGPNIDKLRLAVAKDELAKLLGSQE